MYVFAVMKPVYEYNDEGYTFQDAEETVAVCATKERAERYLEEHYKDLNLILTGENLEWQVSNYGQIPKAYVQELEVLK